MIFRVRTIISRRSAARMTKMRQNMTIIISLSPKPQHASPHKFVNVMA
jgi:hypothetical protein